MKTFSKLSFTIIALLSFQLRAQNGMTKDTGAYDAIYISGPFEVTLTEGQEGSISFEGDEKELEKVTYKIKNNALYIGLEKTRFWGSWNSIKGKIYVEIPVQDINELSISGSGSIKGSIPESDDLKLAISGSGDLYIEANAKTLDCSIPGSGDIHATGTAEELKVSIAGSGSVLADKIEAEDVKVRIAGSGDAKVHATKSLDVSIAGSGDVSYQGNPTKISQDIAGSGKVRAN